MQNLLKPIPAHITNEAKWEEGQQKNTEPSNIQTFKQHDSSGVKSEANKSFSIVQRQMDIADFCNQRATNTGQESVLLREYNAGVCKRAAHCHTMTTIWLYGCMDVWMCGCMMYLCKRMVSNTNTIGEDTRHIVCSHRWPNAYDGTWLKRTKNQI